MKNRSRLTRSGLLLALVLLLSPPVLHGAEDHGSHEDHGEHEEQHGVVELSAAQIEENHIGLQEAGPGELIQSVLLYGVIIPDPQQVSHVTARYPGLIRSVGPSLGDQVEAGDLIATVEASNSLQSYDIAAPISGVVVDRHANPGEIAGEEALLTIADYSQVWADLRVFPGQVAQIHPDQAVRVSAGQLEAEGEIRYLNPGEGRSPTISARVPLSNTGLRWTPGLLVEGHVTLSEATFDLVVDNRALQIFEGRQGVFVRRGNEFHFSPVMTGESDGRFSEVISGLTRGEPYVVENSYLLKADLEKSGASHSH